MANLYYHIGLSKTGSTFIQHDILPLIKSVYFLNKPRADILNLSYPYGGSLSRFMLCSPLVWRDHGEKLFEEIFGDYNSSSRDSTDVLLSDEIGPRDPARVYDHLTNLKKTSKYWGFDRVRIICVIRQQATRLSSHYSQISNRIKGASQKDFESFIKETIFDNYYQEGINYDYNLLAEAFFDLFDKENTLMLPYELMNESMADFLDRWFKFLDRSQEGKEIIAKVTNSPKVNVRNQRSSSRHVWKLQGRTKRNATSFRLRPGRILSRLGFPTTVAIRWPDFKREREIRLTPDIESQIMGVYRESNRRLAKAIGEDLGRYNYY